MVTTKSLTSILALSSLLATPTQAHLYNRRECQSPTPNPLQGCPPGTLLVGPSQTFKTIQSAILSLSLHENNNNSSQTILIQPGTYTEQINVTRPGPLTLLGQTQHPNSDEKNLVRVVWRNATGTAETGDYDNAFTSTLTVAPTLNSSLTGSGPTGNTVPKDTPFGNRDFRAYNVDFVNDYLPYSAGPSLALSVSYANAGFYFCGFYSYQDTIYIGKLANTYIHKSSIAGQTDFLYGFGTLWLQSSTLLLRSCGGAITAWKGTNTTFPNAYGVHIHDSLVQKANSSLNITHKCALGRPWNASHRSIFANTYLDDSIRREGYVVWSEGDARVGKNTTMAEFRDFGPGFDARGRWEARNITMEWGWDMFERYASLEKVFQEPFGGKFGFTWWIDRRPEA